MNKFIFFTRSNWFFISVFCLIILSLVLRFYNYGNRWGLAYDQARDVIVAKEALQTGKIPLIGPFASAGQFVYGPQWFWVIMLFIGIFPFTVIAPWVIQTFLYVAIIPLMILIGIRIKNKLFGLILGLLTAISPAQIAQSTNLTSPSMVSIFSILSIYFFIRYIQEKKILNGFFMSFFVATAINIHFQAIGLLCLIPIAFLLSFKKSLKNFLLLLFGAIIPFIPLIIFDLKNNFFESRNLIDYYLYGQYKIFVPNRWLTYVGIFWPTLWANIIGGQKIIGYLLIILTAIIVSYSFLKRKISKTLLGLSASFILIFILLRYYRGERFDSYFVFIHSFVLIFTALIVYSLLKFNKIIGVVAGLIIIIMSINLDINIIKNSGNFTSMLVNAWVKNLIERFPNNKFAVYDYQYKNIDKSLPLVLFLDSVGKIKDEGIKLGFYIATSKTHFVYPSIVGRRGGYQILDLESTTSAHLAKEEWAFINPSQIYRSTVEWYKK